VTGVQTCALPISAAAALGLGTGARARTGAGATASAAEDDQDSALIERLRRGFRGEGPLGPVVWKVGDRDLREAEPALLELIDARPPAGVTGDQWQHTVLSALVRCGTRASLAQLA